VITTLVTTTTTTTTTILIKITIIMSGDIEI